MLPLLTKQVQRNSQNFIFWLRLVRKKYLWKFSTTQELKNVIKCHLKKSKIMKRYSSLCVIYIIFFYSLASLFAISLLTKYHSQLESNQQHWCKMNFKKSNFLSSFIFSLFTYSHAEYLSNRTYILLLVWSLLSFNLCPANLDQVYWFTFLVFLCQYKR